jgi:hypothetical protein
MKRAEFIEKRVAHWKCEISPEAYDRMAVIRRQAELDAQAAEAAGIAWAPEAGLGGVT